MASTMFALETNTSTTTSADNINTTVTTVTIGDFVWNDFNRNGIQESYEKGVKDIIVGLYAKGSDGVFDTDDDVLIDYTTTDDDGKYLFNNVTPGEYAVKLFDFSFPVDFIVCPMNAGNNPEKDSDFNPESRMSDAFVVTAQANHTDFDAGLFNPCAGFIPSMTIGNAQSIAAGSSVEPLTILSPTIYHPEDYEFQWMKKTAYTNWAPIAGANGMTYLPPAVTIETYFVLCYRLANCPASNYKESNVILIEIDHYSANFDTDNINILIDETTTFTANAGPYTGYDWSVTGGTIVSDNGDSIEVVWDEAGTYTVTLTVTAPDGTTYTTTTTVTVGTPASSSCCQAGQVLTTLCHTYIPAGSSIPTTCNVSVPCQYADAYLATGQYFCGACVGSPSCGTGAFLSSLETEEVAYETTRSTIPSVETTFELDRDVNVFPNPAMTQVTLELNTKHMPNQGQAITVQLLDMQQKVHQVLSVNNTSQVEQLSINLDNLPNGIYLLKIDNGKAVSYMKKFVKMD